MVSANKITVILAIASIALIQVISVQATLKLVLLVHRHGDRNPIKSYPNDPYKDESNWPDGYGELRPEGKQRLYKMGQMLRKRYKDFLTDNPREVHVRSSAADRCLESVSSLLAGCYPPSGRWLWNTDLHWQPFPIQTKPRPQDGMLVTSSSCPAAEAELKRIRDSPGMRAYTAQFKDLFSFLHLNSGANITDIIEAGNLCDVLKVERLAGFKLPSWVTDELMTQLLSILDMTFYYDFSTKLLQRLRTGLLLKDITSKLKYAMSNKTDPYHDMIEEEPLSKKRFFLYSSHDTQIAVTLQALGAFNMLAPPYGSSIVFELHQKLPREGASTERFPNDSFNLENPVKSGHGYFLEIFYWNKTDQETMVPLRVPGCDAPGPCPVNKFIESTDSFIPKDWSSECSLSVIDKLNSAAMIENLFLVTIFGLVSMLLLIFVYIFVKRWRKMSERRKRMPDLDDDDSTDCNEGSIN